MATSAATAPACRPFTAELWLLWIGAAAVNEALLDGVASLIDSEGPVGAPLLLLLAPVAVTLEWLVLRRAVPGLRWGAWLLADACSGVMTFACWLSLVLSTPSGGSITLASCIMTLILGGLAAALPACVISYAAGRYPLPFLLCSAAAAFVVPLDVAIEHGAMGDALMSVTSDISPVAHWLDGPGFRFLPFRPAALLSDAHTIFLLAQALGRVLVNALGAAITGFGLWWFTAPQARHLHQIGK